MKLLYVTLLVYLIQFMFCIQNDFPKMKGCPTVIAEVQTNLTLRAISGTWYEIQRHKSSIVTGKCIRVNISVQSNQTLSLGYSQIINKKSSKGILKATILKTAFWSFMFDASLSGENKVLT